MLGPNVVLKGLRQEIVRLLEDRYIDAKAKKEVYLQTEDADSFFQSMPQAEREGYVGAFTRGLVEVLILEHLDGDVTAQMLTLLQDDLKPVYGEFNVYCSASQWDAMRDIEFFFPHLDALPVERTLAVIKPDAIQKGAIDGMTLEQQLETQLAGAGLFVVGKQEMVLQDAQAQVICQDYKGTEDYAGAIGVVTQEPGVIAMCVEGRGAVGKLQLMCGPTNAGVCKERAPATLRATWGTDSTSNAIHSSSSLQSSEAELKAIFPEGTLKLQRTLCIVKPHAMQNLLQIRMDIEAAGFTVLKEKHVVLTEDRAKEFYRDSKDLPTFNAMVEEATAGKCCIMVLCRLEAVNVWQQVMGPASVSEAKELRPRSVRARFGVEGQRNAVHGSADAKSAAWEVRFFFPEMGADPIPGEDEVRDFLFRKSAGASMDLKSLSSMDTTDYTLDPTLQQMISSGLLALCQVRPKGLAAVNWFREWLVQNNPNEAPSKQAFQPPDRVKQDRPPKPKKVIDVDVSEEREDSRAMDFSSPPFIVFMLGKGSEHCSRLCEELNMIHLDTVSMIQEEMSAETRLGTEIYSHVQKKEPVPDAIILKLLREAIKKNSDTNRFVLTGCPRSAEQAVSFEQEVAPVAFALHVSAATPDPGDQQVVDYYGPIGKARMVDGTREDTAAVYADVKIKFQCRFLYLMGPPGVPLAKIAARLEEKYGYSSIDLGALLKSFAESDEPEAAKVKQALAKGRAIEASIACPLILAEIHRDLAIGVHNFVICEFPHNLKQVEFLEYRVPCVARPILLDFTRADAEDMVATMSSDSGAENFGKTTAYFADDMQAMIQSLPGLVRIPCSLAEMDGQGPGPNTPEGLEAQLVENVWKKVSDKVVPGLTLCLGLPFSGTAFLAPLVAGLTPNTTAVDCNQLLDKEMERKTELGLKMDSMLSKGQVIPLSMTIELLKDIVNLTCSDNLVVENCPIYADQIEQLSSEFRIDKVFYISGDDKAVASWREKYIGSCKDGDTDRAAQEFADKKQRLVQIVTYFSRLGKVDRMEVTETPKKETLAALIDQATMPQFVVVNGLSTELTPLLAERVASSLGAGPAVSMATVAPQETSAETLAKLKQHADGGGYSLIVLDRYIASEEFAREFMEFFGPPKLVVDLACDAEFVTEEFQGSHEDLDEEAATAQMESERATYEAMVKAFEETCPVLKLDKPAYATVAEKETTYAKAADELLVQVKGKMMPTVHVVVAPVGEADFAGAVADGICASGAGAGARQAKMTVLNTKTLFKPGKHSPAIEESLQRALFTAPAPDCLPSKLWVDIFSEAFATSANPMGPFIVTNFPTASAASGGPTIRDQFCLLAGIASFGGILHVRLTDKAFGGIVSATPADFDAYSALDAQVQDQMQKQFDKERVCEVSITEGDRAKAAQKASSEFLAYLQSQA